MISQEETWPSLCQLMPHRPPELYIQKIIETRENSIICSLVVPPHHVPRSPEGFSSTIPGIEYMAQSCAILRGLELKERNEPIRNGFLISLRECHVAVPYFVIGETLYAMGRLLQGNHEMSMFESTLSRKIDDTPLMSATLSIYHP